MNDQDLKNLFKSMKHGEPSEMEVARWKKVVRETLRSRSPGEWTRLAVACLIGIVIGATAFPKKNKESENFTDDATIERVYINLQ